jgi:hypothetical protein
MARVMRGEDAESRIENAGSLPDTGSPSPPMLGPGQIIAHRAWRNARAQVLTALRTGSRLVLVVGPAGTGKTLLLQEIARTLRMTCEAQVLLQSRGDLPIDAGSPVMHGTVGYHRLVVLVDDANRISEAALERLGTLGDCAFVLAARQLADPRPGRDPSGAIARVVRLSPLPPGESAAFMTALLARPGMRPGLSSREVELRLHAQSGGVPRVLNRVAQAALLLARAEGATRVGARHLSRATVLYGSALGLETDDLAELTPILSSAALGEESAEPSSTLAAKVTSANQASFGLEFSRQSRVSPVRATRPARRSQGQTVAALSAAIIIFVCGTWLAFSPNQHRSFRVLPSATIAPKAPAPPALLSDTSWSQQQPVTAATVPSAGVPSIPPSIAPADWVRSTPTEPAPDETAAAVPPSQAVIPAPALPSPPPSSVIAPTLGPAEANAAVPTSAVTGEDATIDVYATSQTSIVAASPPDTAPPPGPRIMQDGQDLGTSPEVAPKASHAPMQEAAAPSIDLAGGGSGPQSRIAILVPRADAPEPHAARPPIGVAAARPPFSTLSATMAGLANPTAELAWAKGHSTGQIGNYPGRSLSAVLPVRAGQPTVAELDLRCRNILIRAQLGEGPSYADKSFLRDRCVSSPGQVR